jgi:phage-related tail fiber protein
MSIQKIKQESLDFGLTGAVAFFGLNTAPAGWLKANGALVSRTTYASLFAVIGTTYGVGNGSTTFALPDMRGEFPRGWDDGRTVDSGRAFGSAQTDAMQGHHHSSSYQDAPYSGVLGALIITRDSGGPNTVRSGQIFVGNPSGDGTNGTPRTSAETRSRNIALLACIKF